MSNIVKIEPKQVESISDVLSKDIKPISQYWKPGSKGKCVAVVSAIVLSNLKNLGATNQIDAQGIELFARDFIDEFKTEKFEDLNLMFSYARRGKFGKDYNRIDSITLFTWFREYLELKYQEKERLKHNEKVEQNDDLEKTSEVVKKQYLDKLKEIREELEKKNKPVISENKATSETLIPTYGDYLQELKEMPLETLKMIYPKNKTKWYKHQDGQYSHPEEIEIFKKRLKINDVFESL